MRLLLNWATTGPDIVKPLMASLKQAGHEVVYWVGWPGHEQNKPTETIYHDYHDAWSCRAPKEIGDFKYDPPSARLIEQMYGVEQLVLTMMNKRRNNLGVEERRHDYYLMLGYWYGVLTEYKIEAVVFPIVPHKSYDYVIYGLCELLGIKKIMFEDPWILGDTMLMYADYKEGSAVLQRLVKENQNKKISPDQLSPVIRDYYLSQTKHSERPPVYINDWKKYYSFLNTLKARLKIVKRGLKNLSVLGKLFSYFYKYLGRNIKKEHAAVQSRPDYSKKYVYAALGFEPERTNSPQGGVYSDQILMVETIAAAVPDDWLVYVKEHPMEWLPTGLNYSSYRYRGYYQKISRLKNVRLMPIAESNYKLIKHSQLVAAGTGTPVWEAIFRGKIGVNFGYAWYRDCPGVYRVSSIAEIKEIIKQVQAGLKPDQQQIINYLRSFEQAGFEDSYVLGSVKQKPLISQAESINNIIKVILGQLAEWQSN